MEHSCCLLSWHVSWTTTQCVSTSIWPTRPVSHLHVKWGKLSHPAVLSCPQISRLQVGEGIVVSVHYAVCSKSVRLEFLAIPAWSKKNLGNYARPHQATASKRWSTYRHRPPAIDMPPVPSMRRPPRAQTHGQTEDKSELGCYTGPVSRRQMQ